VAMDTITKTKPIIGKAIIILLCIIFIVCITRHYFVEGEHSDENITRSSEIFTLHQGEQWFPSHSFNKGDKFVVIIEGAAVKHYDTDNSDVMKPGTYSLVMATDGAPAFEGLAKLSKITVLYSN